MTWSDNLFLDGKGSFRGVEFYVTNAEGSAGRRTVVHEFPQRDNPTVEDMGRAPRRFTLQAFVLGDDYFAQRDRLREEFEKAGPGPLIHPYWGSFTVTVLGPIQIRETPTEGGIARFTVNLIQTSEERQPTAVPDTRNATEIAIADAAESVAEQFVGVEVDEATRADQFARGDVPDEDAWTVFGVIEDVRSKALALGNSVTSKINAVNGYVNAALATADSVGDTITAFNDSLTTLILTPQAMADQMRGMMQDVVSKIGNYEGLWNSYVSEAERLIAPAATPGSSPTSGTPDTGGRRNDVLRKVFDDMQSFGDDFTTIPGSTPQELIAKGNQAAMIRLFKSMSLIEICRAVIDIPFGSFDDATEMRDLLSAILDDLADASGDLNWRALVDLRTAVTRHLTRVASDLPRITQFTPGRTLPALVLAQNLYGDSRQELDLITRNNVRNPAKVPGGVALEVLSSE